MLTHLKRVTRFKPNKYMFGRCPSDWKNARVKILLLLLLLLSRSIWMNKKVFEIPFTRSVKSTCTCTSSGDWSGSIWGLGSWVYLCSHVGCISLQILSKYDISHCSTNLPIQSFQYCFDSCAWLAIFEFPPNFYFPSNSEFELRTLSPWILYVSLLTFLSLPASTLVAYTSNLNIIFFSIQN